MKFLLLLAVLGALAFPANATPRLSDQELDSVGRRVWQNECAGSIDGLTSWNSGEKFASLGIGHFIWYPRGMDGPFDESFPKLLAFLRQRGVEPPDWVASETDCPWPSRSAFQADFHGPRMVALRKFLARTVQHQAAFLAERSREALPKMLHAAPASQRNNIERQHQRLAATSAGTFALIDYVNFKGEGVLPSERYNGEGWGLLQVLAGMNGDGSGATRDFAASAEKVLTRRVQNAPAARSEGRWLPGWKNRVQSYAH